MLDLVLRRLAFRYGDGFALHDVELTVPRGSHTAIVGPAACGASTLLRLVAGLLRPSSGDVILGQRRVNDLGPRHRPLLLVGSEPDVPPRWSVEHALVAAVRTRSLDRQDRHHELRVASERWGLERLLPRRLSTLSSTERTRLQIARIDLFRPAILLADRVVEHANAAEARSLADALYRALRIHGTTVLSAPASQAELALSNEAAVLDGGTIVQSGSPAEVYRRPVSEAAARATGEADVVPIAIRGTAVESVIGAWEIADPPFQGTGLAIVRPDHFAVAGAGEDSDLIFGIEEAGFSDGSWLLRGLLSGNVPLRVRLPAGAPVHKGRLIALRYDPSRFVLLPRDTGPIVTVPMDVVPPMRETR